MTVASPRVPSTRSVISNRRVDHAAAHRAGRPGREPQVGLQPLVDAGCAGPFLRPGVDQLRLAAGPATQRAVGVQPVAAEVHQGAAGEVERPARVAVVRLGHRDQRVDALELAQLTGVEQREQPLHHRVEQVVEPLHHRDPGAPARRRGPPPASSAVEANGFSDSTCLPAATAARFHGPCSALGSGL